MSHTDNSFTFKAHLVSHFEPCIHTYQSVFELRVMLDPNFHITTPRLTLSHIDPDNDLHCDFIQGLNKSPEIASLHQSLSRPVETPEAMRQRLKEGAATLEKTGYGRYLISLRHDSADETQDAKAFSETADTREFIGLVSMQCQRNPGAPPIPDVGFGLLSKNCGKGYATEAAQGLMKYYREERGQTRFAGYCSPVNESSKKVLRRLGFAEVGVRGVKGIVGGDVVLNCMVFTLGLEGEWAW
jgi:RimJ/RimL family protein N-acetyltransferase